MASGPITLWEIGGETVETVSDFIFWGSKITADGDCSHEIKRRLLLGCDLSQIRPPGSQEQNLEVPASTRDEAHFQCTIHHPLCVRAETRH